MSVQSQGCALWRKWYDIFAMGKIHYFQLQKKYPEKIVALDKEEKRVLAYGNEFEEIFKKLKRAKVDPKDCIYVGPIQKQGTISVYPSLLTLAY